MLPSAEDLRASLAHDGFVKVSQVLPGQDLDRLRDAASRAIQQARSGKWPYIRTLPKQFPPWSQNASQGIWGVQHLLHPDMPGREVFAESYFNDTVIEAITRLLDCQRDELVLELCNMLVRPDHDFALRWHRDDIPPDVTPQQEFERLKEPMVHAQWNLALYDDASLIVVPGSHKRAKTDMERSADPYEDDMPGQKVVKLGAGDLLFYNNNILHRGVYDSKTERMTLHGSMGIVGEDKARARNILQHGIGSWAAAADFSDLPGDMSQLATAMQKRLIDMGSGDDVGYSLAN